MKMTPENHQATHSKIINMEQLTEKERQLVAFFLFSASMRIGPSSFSIIETIIDKIEIREEFEFYAKDLLEHANKKNNETPTADNR